MTGFWDMKKKSKVWRITIAASILLFSNLLIAAELTRLVRVCEDCHSKDGYSEDPEVPIIAGFSREGFHSTMDSFRKFKRTSLSIRLRNLPEKYLKMNDIAGRLSKNDIRILADYYSALTFRPAIQEANAVLV